MYYDDGRGLFVPNRVRRKGGYGQVGGGYEKAALSSFRAVSGSASADIDEYNGTMRQRARTLYMSSPLAISAVDTFVSHVVGTGLRPRSRIAQEFLGMSQEKATDWQNRVDFEFNLWAEDQRSCDASGLNNHYKQQQVNLRTAIMSGDCAALFQEKEPSRLRPYALRVRLLEPDRISTPDKIKGEPWGGSTQGEHGGRKVYDGIEVDEDGRVVAIHVSDGYPDGSLEQELNWTRVEAESASVGTLELLNFTMTMCAQRPDQYRGVSIMAPVIESILQLRRYNDSTISAAAVQACLAWFLELSDPRMASELGPQELPDLFDVGPTQAGFLPDGYTLKSLDTTQPGGNYKPFTDSYSEQISAGMRSPGEVVRKVFDSSYSASQAAIQEYHRECELLRYDVINGFSQPTRVRWLAEAVARGRIEAPGFFTDPVRRKAFCQAIWVGPPKPVIDPVKEQKALEMAIANHLTTREDAVQKLDGGDFRAVVAQLAREEELMRKYGLIEETGNGTI